MGELESDRERKRERDKEKHKDRQLQKERGKSLGYLIVILLFPAVAVITCGIGLHGHSGDEVLHSVVAQVVADRAKIQQVPVRGPQTTITLLEKGFQKGSSAFPIGEPFLVPNITFFGSR